MRHTLFLTLSRAAVVIAVSLFVSVSFAGAQELTVHISPVNINVGQIVTETADAFSPLQQFAFRSSPDTPVTLLFISSQLHGSPQLTLRNADTNETLAMFRQRITGSCLRFAPGDRQYLLDISYQATLPAEEYSLYLTTGDNLRAGCDLLSLIGGTVNGSAFLGLNATAACSAIVSADAELYSQPRASATVIGTVGSGETIYPLIRLDNAGWYLVFTSAGSGWISAASLRNRMLCDDLATATGISVTGGGLSDDGLSDDGNGADGGGDNGGGDNGGGNGGQPGLPADCETAPDGSLLDVDACLNLRLGDDIGVNANINAGVGGNTGVNANINAGAGGNNGVNVGVDANVNTGGNTGVNANVNAGAGGNNGVNVGVDANVNTGDNTGVNANVNAGAGNDGININAGIDTGNNNGIDANVNVGGNGGIDVDLGDTNIIDTGGGDDCLLGILLC